MTQARKHGTHRSPVTPEQLKKVKLLLNKTEMSTQEIAEVTDLGVQTVRKVKNGVYDRPKPVKPIEEVVAEPAVAGGTDTEAPAQETAVPEGMTVITQTEKYVSDTELAELRNKSKILDSIKSLVFDCPSLAPNGNTLFVPLRGFIDILYNELPEEYDAAMLIAKDNDGQKTN